MGCTDVAKQEEFWGVVAWCVYCLVALEKLVFLLRPMTLCNDVVPIPFLPI